MLSVEHRDICDDSSDDDDDVQALRERHLVDSDSDSPLEYRCLARRYEWYASSSGSSDSSSLPFLEYDTEDSIEAEICDLIPVAGRTPLSPKFATFLEDEILYHETSSVSSSATNCASSSSSDCSTQGDNGLPADSIHLWHIAAFNEQLQCHMLKSARTWRLSLTLPDDDNCPSTNIVDYRPRTLSGLPRPCGWDEDSTDSSDASELCLSTDDAVFDNVRTAHDATHQHQVRASMQRVAALRSQIDVTGSIIVRRWLGPCDAFSHHATSSMSSSAMNYASSSSSDTSTHGIHFWTSQASREPPTIAHTDSWTPVVTGRSRIRCLVGSDKDTADQCNWDQRSTELQHLNSPTGRCMDPDAASHTFTSHNVAP